MPSAEEEMPAGADSMAGKIAVEAMSGLVMLRAEKLVTDFVALDSDSVGSVALG